jgi:hypothetical protein
MCVIFIIELFVVAWNHNAGVDPKNGLACVLFFYKQFFLLRVSFALAN